MESVDVSTKQRRIAELARIHPELSFTSLAHNIDLGWLREAYWRTRKDGALGVDGQVAEEYAKGLEENLRSLLERAKSGTYFAPPVRRVHIPKGTGTETRPIGVFSPCSGERTFRHRRESAARELPAQETRNEAGQLDQQEAKRLPVVVVEATVSLDLFWG